MEDNTLSFTKNELIESILYLAKKINMGENYKIILYENNNLPSLIKMLIYDLFCNRVNIYKHGTHYYKIIGYCDMLNEFGYVNFKE